MKRYIAVDSGKFSSKVVEYLPDKKCIRKMPIRTKASAGDFRDDAIEEKTVVVEIDGNVYKIGKGARGNGAELETSKTSEIHKLCILTALATYASANEVDEIYLAIGLPAMEWDNVKTREEHRGILPLGQTTVSIKTSSNAQVKKKVFDIKKIFVYPESIGPLLIDGIFETINNSSITGVIDIGNLNMNASYWQGTDFKADKSLTTEDGGAILIQELAQEISSNVTFCDDMIAANILKSETKTLPENINLSAEEIETCNKITKNVLKKHANKIKRNCKARNWPLNLMNIIAIGGTAIDIKDELIEEFGDRITFLPNSEFINAFGFLRMMCSQFPELGLIPLVEEKELKNQTGNISDAAKNGANKSSKTA